jgi:amino acid adenylation domain-containing protein
VSKKSDWPGLAATFLGCAPEVVAERGQATSFTALGGTSIQAAALVATGERELGLTADLAGLLSAEPFANVVGQAVTYTPVQAPQGGAGLRPLLPEQGNLLSMDSQVGGSSNHMLFTAEFDQDLDEATLVATLATLTRRHEALRTVFKRHRHSARRRVVPKWQPRLLIEQLTPAAGDDPVELVQTRLVAASSALIAPYEQPPVVFVWTRLAGRGDLLSLLFHHTVLDGWSAGLFWREFAAVYAAGGEGSPDPGPSPEVAVARHKRLVSSGALAKLAQARVEQLTVVRETLELPSDLVPPSEQDPRGVRHRFSVGPTARDAAGDLAAQTGVTRTAVLLTAWGLVLARRAGIKDFLLAMAVAGRPTSDLQETVAMCTRVVPIRFTVDDDSSVADCVRLTAARMAEAVTAAEVPFGQLVMDLGRARDFESLPFPKFCFAAHDDMVPHSLTEGSLTFALHEGHSGGTVFDATLFVQRWEDSPRFALEYKPSVLTLPLASGLGEAFEQTLTELAAAPTAPLETIRGMSARQRQWLEKLRDGPPGSSGPDPWELIAEHGRLRGAEPAVRAADAELSYAGLVSAVATQATELAAAGVTSGDRVVVCVPRSAAEIVAVLAALRQGAAYVAVDPAASEGHIREVLRQTAPRALIAPQALAGRLSSMSPESAVLSPWTPDRTVSDPVAAAAPPDPERVAYVAFTSGSTGRPKGVMVPNRGIVRLVHNVEFMPIEPGESYLRLAPLAFDASTLEIFTPLLGGGISEVFPDGPVSPSPLADFLNERAVHHVFLTAGLFRLQADHRPDGFSAVRHAMTGGDVVPAGQMRELLASYPGLRVSNLYGPTENSVVTTAFSAEDPCEVSEPLPIGNAIPATSVLVLDERLQPVPPGGIGELYTGGLGLATGYLGLAEETLAQFGCRAPDNGEPLYRTGDLVRFDDSGKLRFLGRRDHQIKISGYRIEPDAIAARLRAHPGVRDAMVCGTAGDAASRRLIAGVVAEPSPELPAELRRWVAQTLPDYAVPSLWAVVESLPVTANGKVDAQALEQAAAEQALAGLEEVVPS